MPDVKYGLTAIGNALVDVLARSDEAFIEAQAAHGMKRGMMNLIPQDRATELYAAMGPAVEMSGGSAGNTMACYASFGGKGAYIGKVAADQLGEVFRHDLRAQGVTFDTAPLNNGTATGRCMILVTPDGERTMNTFLGAAVELSPADIDEALIASSAVTYMEGYLFDPPLAKEAFRKVALVAHKAGRKVSLTLSDPFCVDRHRADFRDLVDNHVDILFANEQEIMSLYETGWDAALAAVRGKCDLACITRSEKGCVILSSAETYTVPAEKVEKVVDSTGAGDAFAAGFLFGYGEGRDPAQCGRLGAIAAAEVIGHMGPRPEIPLARLLPKLAA